MSLILVPLSGAMANPNQLDSVYGGSSDSSLRVVERQEDGPTKQVQTFARGNYVWPFATGPYYGSVALDQRRADGVLQTRVGSFDLKAGALPVPAELKTANRLGELGAQYFVVQFDANSVKAGAIDALATRVDVNGGAIVADMPVLSVVTRLTPEAYQAVSAMGGARIEPYHAAFKLDPSIGRVPLLDPRKAVSEVYDLEISLWAGEDAQVAAQAIAGLGGNVTRITPDTIYAELHRSKLASLAKLEPVRFVTEDLPLLPFAEETTTTVMTGAYNQGSVPYHDAGIDGSGNGIASTQIAMVLDSGIQIDAGDLAHSASNSCADMGSFDANAASCLSGHRKVISYETTVTFGGTGDLRGCDSNVSGGFTHGHTVSSTMLGAGKELGFEVPDNNTPPNFWQVDGLAPGALLIAYDAQVTPPAVSCADPLQDTISPGDLYAGGATGSLGVSYSNGARVVNFSWGANSNTYTANASDIDTFMNTNKDSLVFVSAGNAGQDGDNDGVPDPGTLGTPATTKNGFAVGASRHTNLTGSAAEGREAFSSTGPGPQNRVAPQIMAPGGENAGGTLGLSSEFSCLTGDNDQEDPVVCDVVSGVEGTSFSSPAAAGAALLVRDYFAQGFYPDGTSSNPGNAVDQVDNVSGALVKSVLIASTDFMTGGNTFQTNGNALVQGDYRFNNIQGYGRVLLANALPLQSDPDTVTGLIVHDGHSAAQLGGSTPAQNIPGLPVSINASTGQNATGTFEVCDNTQELRVALSWVESASDGLINDLDLTLISPSGVVYFGNYFTDDDNRNNVTDMMSEDCPDVPGNPNPTPNLRNASQWSLPTCTRGDASLSPHDSENPTEAVMLSNDYYNDDDTDGDGVIDDPNTSDDNQVELGTWTIQVGCSGGVSCGSATAQNYAVAISGGVCLGSSARFDAGRYVCNDDSAITISELDDGSDAGVQLANSPAANEAEVSDRTTIEVLAANVCDDCTSCVTDSDCTGIGGGTCNAFRSCDTETGLAFTQVDPAGLVFELDPAIQLTDGTFYDPGNGVLDVQDGDRLLVTYADETGGAPDPDKVRTSTANVGCSVDLTVGAITFLQFGRDGSALVNGGCERNERGLQEFGFPDRYLDEDEQIVYNFAFGTQETSALENVEVALSCVIPDGDSPADCRPNTTACPDPRRENNTPCNASWLTILDSPQTIGLVPANAAISANFSIAMGSSIPDMQPVEFILSVSAPNSGKGAQGIAVTEATLDADEVSKFYSTDFPDGGVEFRDRQNNEHLQGQLGVQACIGGFCEFTGESCTVDADCDTYGAPITNIGDFLSDYQFEVVVWSPLTANGKNAELGAPWNFDTNDGGFSVGLGAVTDESTIGDIIAQWGEDKNFNGELDGFCFVDPEIQCQVKEDCPSSTPCVLDEDRDPQGIGNDPGASAFLPGRAWGYAGGCGWQTKAPNTCSVTTSRPCFVNSDCPGGETCSGGAPVGGGIWHTGRIRGAPGAGTCMVDGNNAGQCQRFETVGGDTGQRLWFELLRTPPMQKVNGTDHEVEITWWGWNQQVDLPDNNVAWTWEFDTDTAALEPVDLVSDLSILNFGFGAYGPITDGSPQGNPDLTNGWNYFAPLAGVASANGTVGNNRVGDAGCYLEGNTPAAALTDIGLSLPEDDDLNNGYCQNAINVSCAWVCVGGTGDGDQCNTNADCGGGTCTDAAPECGGDSCVRSNSDVDEYVTTNGPIRNMDIFAFNGPDMRFSTLEDIFGDTGEEFQAALGIINFEKVSASAPDPVAGYGIGVDDMYVEWREFTLGPDQTDCATGGACAAVDLQSANFYEGNALLTITVLDNSTGVPNDCNDDGDTDDGVDDQDCNNNGIDDVRVKANSDAEVAGEYVTLDEVNGAVAGALGSEYRGQLPISVSYNVAGVLFLQASGTQNPVVTVTYNDDDDGTGQICQNDVDPAARGQIQATTTVIVGGGSVTVTNIFLDDNADQDGFADTRERIEARVAVSNKTGIPLTGVTARLASNDPNIACILNSFTTVGSMAVGETVLSDDLNPLVFQVADVDRTTLGLTDLDTLTASLSVIIQADQFDSTVAPQNITIDLDLDATGGSGPTEFFEGFESGTFGQFTSANLDSTTASLATSDGTRCSYSDPDYVNSNSYNTGAAGTCYPGNPMGSMEYSWKIVGQPSDGPLANRAFGGTKALYMGVELPSDELTTPLGVLEAIVTTNPVNIGWDKVCETSRNIACTDSGDCPGGEECVGVAPEFSFKHQVSLVDSRQVNIGEPEAAGRGVLMAQLADAGTGTGVGDWIKLQPFENNYDIQTTDNYTNCFFDPTDDGTDEDDFFDPSDPDRRLGPSSTCYPEFSWTYLGDTDAPFAEGNLGRASDGPGLEGSVGDGTWVESKVNLIRFRGRRLRFRFLNGDIKASNVFSHEALFGWNPTPVDDGWFIDEIVVTDTLTTPATVSNDDKDNSGLPDECGAGCTTASAVLDVDPGTSLSAPGQVVEFSAAASSYDVCPDGTGQYRYSINGQVVRDWTDNADFIDAPLVSTLYTVDFRCSSAPMSCLDSQSALVTVACPGAISIDGSWNQATLTGSFGFGGSINYVEAQGTLATLRSGSYATASDTTGSGTSFAISGAPASGQGEWYLFRKPGDAGCNTLWSTQGAGECAGFGVACPAGERDGNLP